MGRGGMGRGGWARMGRGKVGWREYFIRMLAWACCLIIAVTLDAFQASLCACIKSQGNDTPRVEDYFNSFTASLNSNQVL